MKKLTLILLFITFFISCSKDDSNNPNGVLNPPEWIIGTWGYTEYDLTHSYTFTKNNIFEDRYGAQTLDWAAMHIYDEASKTGGKIQELEKTAETYKVKMSSIVMGQELSTATYTFQKADGSYIVISISPMNEEIDYTKQ